MGTDRLAGQVAVVSGGARGLGAAFAAALRADGATVVTCNVRDGADERVGHPIALPPQPLRADPAGS